MFGENIKFSVLVPVYNAEEYLDACVQSVLRQTYQNFELILVNDGSKDKSGEICDKYAQEHSNITGYHKENAGQLHTREYAIKRATGDYYVFLDADDTLRENALETIHRKISEYNCDCVIYQLERVWEGKVLVPAAAFSDICITDKRELYKKCLLSASYNSMCRKAVKASVFDEEVDYSRDYSIRYGEDLIQTLTVLKNSNVVVFIDDVLYNYRVNPQSIMHSIDYENIGYFEFSEYLRVLDFLEKENIWEKEDYDQLRNYCVWLLCTKLLEFCRHRLPFGKKRKIIKRIRMTDFYKRFLSCAHLTELELGKRKHMFTLFQNGHDTTLIVYLWLYWQKQGLIKWLKDRLV